MNYFMPKIYLPRPDRLLQNMRAKWRHSEADLKTIEAVLAEYELELVEIPASGRQRRSRSLVVKTSEGKKVFKEYNQTLSQSNIRHEHSILNRLAQLKFPSPRLLTTKMSDTLACYGDQTYALFDFIEGGFHYHNYMLFPWQTRRFVAIAGEMLALLHDVMKDFVPEGHSPHGFKSHQDGQWRDLDWYLDKLAYCITKTESLDEGARVGPAARLLQQAGFLEETLIQLDAQLEAAALPRTIIHADYGPYNLLFRKNAPAVMLDFELARLDWRVADVVRAFYRFAYSKKNGFRWEHIKYLMEGYQTHLLLTMDEVRLMPDVWNYWNICRCIVNWYGYWEFDNKSGLARARESLEMTGHMKRNRDEFVGLLSAVCH